MAQAKRRWTFDRWLYRNYRQGSALGNFIVSRVKPAAWLWIGALGMSFLMGANVGQSMVVVFSLLVFSMLVVALVWSFFRKANFSAIRLLPPTGSVGEEVPYVVEITNRGRKDVRDVLLREAGDDPRPTEWEFRNLREPGEEKRNLFDRTLAYYRWKWLLARGGHWDALDGSSRLELPAGETQTVPLKILPNRRGVLKLNDLRAELPDPFGLFQRRRPMLNEEGEILIVPKRYRLPALHLGGQSELKIGGETASTIRGDGGEFMGLREYRPGDSLRHIHWKAWARIGQPIVKEYEEIRFPRYGLVLDTNLSGSGPAIFEEAVSVAASFVTTMDRERCLLDLMFVREEPEVFTAGRGVARAARLMEILARVEASEESGYESLRKLVMRYADEMTACVVVLTGWDESREEFVNQLRASGLQIKVLAVGAGEMPDEVGKAGVCWLRWNAVQEDLLKIT